MKQRERESERGREGGRVGDRERESETKRVEGRANETMGCGAELANCCLNSLAPQMSNELNGGISTYNIVLSNCIIIMGDMCSLND